MRRTTLCAPSAEMIQDGSQFFQRAVGMAQHGPGKIVGPGRRSLGQRDHFRAPFDGHALRGDCVAQERLGLDLRDEQYEGEAALHMSEIQPEKRLAFAVKLAATGGQPPGDQRLSKAALMQQFQCPGLHADGARGRRRLCGLVDQADGDTHAGQFQGGSEAGGASTDDQNKVGHLNAPFFVADRFRLVFVGL